MDKYVETLDALMKAKKEKKKKEPTIKEKEAFRSAWLGLVADWPRRTVFVRRICFLRCRAFLCLFDSNGRSECNSGNTVRRKILRH